MGFSPVQLSGIEALCRQYEVHELLLFGSRARGDSRQDSDYDFLVEFEQDSSIGLYGLIRLNRDLSDLLNALVDLVPRRT